MEDKRLSVKIDKELYKKICQLSLIEGKKIGFLIDKAIMNYLKSKQGRRTNGKSKK